MSGRLCREYRSGDLVRCPGPGRHRAHCDAPLLEVGAGCRARACVGATDAPGPHTVKKCKVCQSMVRIEVWAEGEGAA